MPEKIYDGITAVNLRRTKNDIEMMTALLPSNTTQKILQSPLTNKCSVWYSKLNLILTIE